MTCQEVNEYMQRYLDKDLSDSEHTTMLAHLPNCQNCTEMFERMKLLSNKLVNLPKVAPPYSIVDSIMPQLDEIERNLSSSAGQNEEDRSVAIPWRKRFKASSYYKAIGGVVAAGLVFAVISLGGIPGLLNSSNTADEMSMNTGGVNDSVMIMESAGDEMSSTFRSAEPTSEGAPVDGQTKSMPEAVVQEQAPITSPDGAYTAAVKQEGMQHQVVITDKDQAEVYTTPAEEANYLNNLYWSDDSKVFRYELWLGDKFTLYVIDMDSNSRSIVTE